jgi:protocatechuate 3,4-dioxygenase beta subunit
MDPELNRRQALGALGAVTLGAFLPGCGDDEQARSCRVTAELTEGPFYVDADALRRDIREDRAGVPLGLELRVREADSCRPISDAAVDVWHCDAQGAYSAGRERFLRGTQVTDRQGLVEFVTVYPGWYQGRTPHIHVKIRLDRRAVLTTQLFFDDELSARVFRDRRYARDGAQQVDNAGDGIFDESLVVSTRRRSGALVGAMTFDVERA